MAASALPLALGTLLGLGAAAVPAVAQVPGRTSTPPPPREYTETYERWRVYCQVWSAPRRVECEIATRAGVGTSANSRIAWLRSSERWLDGLRFRLEEGLVDASGPVRIWVDRDLFRPEFPCRPFAFETNTCAVTDPAVNAALVERMKGASRVSAVGVAPGTRTKAEARFPLAGFRAAVERTEAIRAEAGVAWK